MYTVISKHTRQFHLIALLLLLRGFSTSNANTSFQRLDSLALAVKSIQAVRITTPPKIDAVMSEPFWQKVPVAGDFVEYSPRNAILPPYGTEIRFAYDDVALYIFATMFDPYPDSICKELGRRDQIEELFTDYISFDILPYNDGLNMYEFKVSPAGLQNDCKYTAVGQDVTWDAVWESAASINSESWTVELKLPYSALRFPKIDKQVWGINMWRNFRRTQEWSTWTFVDNSTQDVLKYYGTLTGIENVNPPRRLSFSPYVAGYTEKSPESDSWQYSLRGGLDLRYGINEAFTLDMMLIPDFGQVQSDDVILNLTPFEVRYNENRQFFTEATELFEKCEIFYSRRVGGTPQNYFAPYDSTSPDERVISNPDMTRIINATKLSGRNSKGWGYGFFNAMTTNTYGVLENNEDKSTRKILTQPFTNYNVSVIDKNLKNNSYITLINTNYFIPSTGYSANVSGVESKIANKKNSFSFLGRFNVSQKYFSGDSSDLGHQYLVAISKPSGKFQYQLLRQETGSTYDPNEMGFLLRNNEAINRLRLSYNILDPVWKIRSSQNQFFIQYSSLVKPNSFTDLMFDINNYTAFQNFWGNYFEVSIRPLGSDDYYESRVWGLVYKRPASYDFAWNLASDNRKKFRFLNSAGFTSSPENNNFLYFIEATPRMRFTDRFMVSLTVNYTKNLSDYGWVENEYETEGNVTSWFGQRDVTTISNILNIRYIFSTKTSLTLRARHYWSKADYSEYYTLQSEGSLTPGEYENNADINFNAFTADLNFGWYFAPGSELSIMWKNSIYTLDQNLVDNYFNDFGNTIGSPQTNGFSVKFLYYIDYLYVKKWFGKEKPGNKMQGKQILNLSDFIQKSS
jgi:hypothetical protein